MNKIFFQLLLFLFCEYPAHSQNTGCTDVLAKNYNSKSTINNGTCRYKITQVSPVNSSDLAPILKETSGLIYYNNLIWTHNDDTDNNLYSLNSETGTINNTIPLKNTRNNDWEEISQDEKYIYIGNFGNNVHGNRKDLKILRVLKNSLKKENQLIDTIHFSFSNQTDFTPKENNKCDFDCEAFIVTKDSIYLFTKQWISNKTSIYSLPKTPGKYSAHFNQTRNIEGLVTGAVYLEKEKTIALCGYSNLMKPFIYLLYDFKNNDFFGGNKRKIIVSLPFHQVEGITTNDGLTYYLTNESYIHKPFINSPQKLFKFDLSPYLKRQITKK